MSSFISYTPTSCQRTYSNRYLTLTAARTHSYRDNLLDVHTFIPFGERTFLVSSIPEARISPLDILTIFPSSHVVRMPAKGMLELPQNAFEEFMKLNGRMQERYEKLFDVLTAKVC